jgi:hypothetical protein
MKVDDRDLLIHCIRESVTRGVDIEIIRQEEENAAMLLAADPLTTKELTEMASNSHPSPRHFEVD